MLTKNNTFPSWTRRYKSQAYFGQAEDHLALPVSLQSVRMLSATSWLSSAVLLVALCRAQAQEPSLNNSKPVGGLNDGTRCSWNCTITDSEFLEEIKTKIAKEKVIRLVVKYEKRVNDKCLNHNSRNSSGNITEHWQIWLPNKQLSVFAKALESVANLMFFTDSNADREEIGAICTLRPVNMTATKVTQSDSDSFPVFFQSHLSYLGVRSDSIDTETTDNLQRWKNITEPTGNNSSTFEGPLKRVGWPVNVLASLNLGFVVVFFYYSPAFLCFFSPTEVTQDGVHQIVLDGASPVSLRSLIGNYFFSKENRVRMFVLRAVVLPFPFFGLATFAEYVIQNNESLTPKVFGLSLPSLFHPLMIVFYVCYYIMVCFMSFSPAGFKRVDRLCAVCKRLKSKTLTCQENVPKQITNHLRIQPLILVQCSRLFIRHLLTYFKGCFFFIPSAFEFSLSFFLRLLLFIVLLSASPAAIAILLILILLVIFGALLLTCPLFNIFSEVNIKRRLNVYFRLNGYLFLWSLSVCTLIKFVIGIPALFGASVVLYFAGVGVDVAILLAFLLLLTKEGLPFAACSVLVLYYLWSSYTSFTNKYQDLGLALFIHYKSYKTSRHSQVMNVTLTKDPLLENTQNAVGNNDNLVKIPKELLQMAYEELMPIRESVCVLILKVTIIVSFVLFVFSLIMLLNVSASPAMRAFLTFASGSLPKIVAIYMDGRRQKNIEALTADEKIRLIVQKYIEAISAVNHGQENSGVDIDEEISHNVNEENIQLAIM